MAEYEWKPAHEETWHARYDDVYVTSHADDPEDDWELAFEGSIGLSGMQKRLQLAAAAPEMARLLLELVETTDERDYYKLSPDECERILAVLRKAGCAS